MSVSDRPSSIKNWTGTISVLVTIITAGAAIVARFSALEEAKTIAVENIRDLQQRVGAIERSNAMLERVHSLEKSDVELHTELIQVREELRELRSKLRR